MALLFKQKLLKLVRKRKEKGKEGKCSKREKVISFNSVSKHLFCTFFTVFAFQKRKKKTVITENKGKNRKNTKYYTVAVVQNNVHKKQQLFFFTKQ